ncbi:MAG: response regulator [Clostridiales bacterium]|nr:response regulator [Clostridiales bacterium]HBM81163.1 DNA-binding response regulator [Clostridiaceae bacterium]
MFKLFIVDDEPETREGLKSCIDWANYGIRVVGEADDGKIALERILKEKPDIVLTDVRMPDMGGIELANKLRDLKSDVKIVFISGYDDVAYLKSALKVEAVDYILKPVDLNELDGVIRKVLNIISEEDNRKRLINEMSARLTESMPALRQKFLMTLVRDGIECSEDYGKRMDFLGLKLPADKFYCIFVLSVDDRATALDSLSERDNQLISLSVIKICDELICSTLQGYTFENRRGEYVCILRLDTLEDEDKLYPLVCKIKDKLFEYLELSITIGVGETVHKLENIVKSYMIAYENVKRRLFLGKNRIITMDSLETLEDSEYKFDFTKIQLLVNILKSADKEKVIKSIDDIFNEMSKYKNGDINYCTNICLQLVLTASRQVTELNLNINDERFDEDEIWKKLLTFETLLERKMFIKDYFVAVCGCIAEKRNKKSKNIIRRIKQVIDNRYRENITIKDIAKEVYLSTTYLCMIFKQETGETVNDYLTSVRIKKAKELLMDPKYRQCDICYEIGYTEPGYFSRIFKKYTGLSPTEYRETML